MQSHKQQQQQWHVRKDICACTLFANQKLVRKLFGIIVHEQIKYVCRHTHKYSHIYIRTCVYVCKWANTEYYLVQKLYNKYAVPWPREKCKSFVRHPSARTVLLCIHTSMYKCIWMHSTYIFICLCVCILVFMRMCRCGLFLVLPLLFSYFVDYFMYSLIILNALQYSWFSNIFHMHTNTYMHMCWDTFMLSQNIVLGYVYLHKSHLRKILHNTFAYLENKWI